MPNLNVTFVYDVSRDDAGLQTELTTGTRFLSRSTGEIRFEWPPAPGARALVVPRAVGRRARRAAAQSRGSPT